MAVAFLRTRVSEPDVDDWVKLTRVLQYLKGTINLVLTIGADNLNNMDTLAAVSYGVHPDSRSHTGGCISFGWGVILKKSQKQKINTKVPQKDKWLVSATIFQIPSGHKCSWELKGTNW